MSEETLRLELAAERNEIARLESELREARRLRSDGADDETVAEIHRLRAALSAERTARRAMREALEGALPWLERYAPTMADNARAALAAGEGPATPESAYWCARCDHQRSVHSTVPCHGIYLDAARPSTKCDCVAFVETLPPEGHPRAAEGVGPSRNEVFDDVDDR